MNENFDDFTVEEQLLWGKNVGFPFKDYPLVFRAVITRITYDVAQQTPAVWYQSLIDKEIVRAEDENFVEAEARWRMEKAVEVQAVKVKNKNVPTLFAWNLLDWVEDVIELRDVEDGLDLRRQVVNQLNNEAAAAGDWSLWLIHLHWVMLRREAETCGTAMTDWKSWIKDASAVDSEKLGTEALLDWNDMLGKKGKVETAAEEEMDGGDGDLPDPLDLTGRTRTQTSLSAVA